MSYPYPLPLTGAGSFTADDGESMVPSVDKLLDIFQSVLNDVSNTRVTKEYVMNALMKMSARTGDGASRIRTMVRGVGVWVGWRQGVDLFFSHSKIGNYRSSMDEEMQQRSAEYMAIFARCDHLRWVVGAWVETLCYLPPHFYSPALLERMPVAKSKVHAVAASGAEQIKSPASVAGEQGYPARFLPQLTSSLPQPPRRPATTCWTCWPTLAPVRPRPWRRPHRLVAVAT